MGIMRSHALPDKKILAIAGFFMIGMRRNGSCEEEGSGGGFSGNRTHSYPLGGGRFIH